MDSSGIHPLPEKVQAISDYPQPHSRRQLRTFLGLVNFYHRFIPGCARILQPLNDLLSATHGHSSTVLWDDVTTTAFSQIKEALASVTLLASDISCPYGPQTLDFCPVHSFGPAFSATSSTSELHLTTYYQSPARQWRGQHSGRCPVTD